MGLKDWLKGKDADPVLPLKIQDLEAILAKRRSENTGAVILIIEGQEYRLITDAEYDRIMAVVDAIEALGKRLNKD